MEIDALFVILNSAIFEVGARQSINGVGDRLALVAQGENKLLERVTALLAEHDQMRQNIAEVIHKSAAVGTTREL
jgi:hypothetical protein